MSKFVELEYRIMQVGECKVRGDDIRFRIIGGMLYRRKVVYLLFARYDYNAAGVLTCRPLYAHAVADYAVDLGAAYRLSLCLKILCDKAVCRFVGKGTERSGTENVFGAEKLFCKFMHLALHLARKVEVDIR